MVVQLQIMMPLLNVSTIKGLINLRSHCKRLAMCVSRKLCVLPEFTIKNKGYLSTFLLTFKAWNPILSSKAIRDKQRVVTSALNSSPLLSSFKASFSSSIMRMEYILLVLHLCPGTNFSLHQKHKPLALHSPSSLFIMALVGLVLVLMRKLYGGGITIIFRGVF